MEKDVARETSGVDRGDDYRRPTSCIMESMIWSRTISLWINFDHFPLTLGKMGINLRIL